jgi:hypothetical protein
MKYLKRQLEDTILSARKTFPAILVTGPRQSGKTTLLKTLLSKYADFVSLEEPDIRLWAIEDPRDFLARKKTPLILDEIQYALELLPYIKQKIDDDRKPGQWFLTGSQQFSMMKNVSESLAGRIAILNLLPFSFSEIKKTHHPDWDEWFNSIKTIGRKKYDLAGIILNGSYPELAVNNEINRKLWYDSYIQTYLERDIKAVYDIGNLTIFIKFITMLASRCAQIMNYSSYAGDLGVSVPTIKRWLSILEASFIIYTLPPFYENIGKRLIKSSKIYFVDTGLAAYLSGIYNEDVLLRGPMAGALFENFVISEFLKNFYNHGERPGMFFLNNKNLWEIDLILERNLKFVPIEIKLSATITSGHLKNFFKARDIIENIDTDNYLICSHEKNYQMNNTRICSWMGL